ncbi:DUF1499 domain-containing protein [Mesorhizobium sp. YIM 152430]|uniref:DUF1499 domain-containing protein n=1 Tax=Mesorhizobium sp. YIM 152430 TaxID=3031761 RepID=UPI0023DBB464|nr:DUF1499 domain-containing protein [Mesorhizobium sp. YIM 152430]MDF1601251.1 DUF1499 domain-containing protein [Mesorhizobium sp. YIM 152430]
MARDDYRQYTPQARPAQGIAFFALVLFVLASLAHRFGSIPTPEFLWVLGIVAGLALVALILAVFALRRIWIEDDAGTGPAVAGLLLALIVLAPFGVGLQGFLTHPRLTDIATDRTLPPDFVAAAENRDARMNPIRTIAPDEAEAMRAAYPELVARSFALPLADMTQAVLRVADARGFDLLGRMSAPGGETLEFIGYSFLLGFPSDIAIRLRAEGETTRVDMRSASRYGGHDQGENARRIVNFLDALDYEVDVVTGVIVEEE